jgi:hypothetical protein
MGLFGRKKEIPIKDKKMTSPEFVDHLIKYPNESDEIVIKLYRNLIGEDNLEKDVESYWQKILDDSFIDKMEFERLTKEFTEKFERVRMLANQE